MFYQDFTSWKFPRFLQGIYLKTALTQLPLNAKEEVVVMLPYLIQSETLNSLLNLPEGIKLTVLTRDHTGYLPSIKSGAQPAVKKLMDRPNSDIYNDIHAKILVIDNDFCIIHSMNGTPRSENTNHEAGIITIDKSIIEETREFIDFVKDKSKIVDRY